MSATGAVFLGQTYVSGMADELEPDPVELKAELTPRERQLAALRPWKKGQSGNPTGRSRKMTEAYDYVLGMEVPDAMLKGRYAQLKGSGITFADLVALSMTVIAAFPTSHSRHASIMASKEISNRVEGKVSLTIEQHVTHSVLDLTPEERHRRILEIAKRTGDYIEGEVVEAEDE